MVIDQEIHEQVEIQTDKVHRVVIVKDFYPIHIVIDVEANKTAPYHLASNSKTFDFAYEITTIHTSSETNALVGTLFTINGQLFPCESYFIDATPKNYIPIIFLDTDNHLLHSLASGQHEIFKDLHIKLETGWKLEFYPYNSHTSAQKLYITLLGHKVFTKVLK